MHSETRPVPNPEGIGNLHHIAFTVSRSTYLKAAERLDARAGGPARDGSAT